MEGKKRLISIILILCLIIVMAYTNPDEESFKEHLQDDGVDGIISVVIIPGTINEKDYFVFTIYEYENLLSSQSDNTSRYIGVFNNFLRVK